MAFPGTFNISYYKGDTYEFNIYPKDSTGQPFDMNSYAVNFTIADVRGSLKTLTINSYALLSTDGYSVSCAIAPEDGELMTAGTTYAYDVQITDQTEGLPYSRVYTILTGSISVSEQVTGA